MSRSRATARKAGSAFERLIADHLKVALDDDRIDRRVKTGRADKGDIGGVRVRGQRVVVECKNYGGRLMPGPWVDEAHVEMLNDDALAAVVIAKRRGTTDPGSQLVLMTVSDLIGILVETRPDK